jgi:pilus assembly protein Flp/PilA
MHSPQLHKNNETNLTYGANTMNRTTHSMTNLVKGESGQGLIEYALIAGLIGLVAVLAMTATGSQISAAFSSISNTLASAI